MTDRTLLAGLGAMAMILSTTVFGCDDSGGGGGGGDSGSIAFHGEQEALPGFSYDTGFQPEDSPIQVRLLLESTGGLTADATAESDGSTMTADASSGQFALDAHIQIQALLRVEVPGIDPYEGRSRALPTSRSPSAPSRASRPSSKERT